MQILVYKATDEELVRRIESAKRSLALYAPGVSIVVAKALCAAMHRLNGNVKVVLDLSRHSIELGYLQKDAIRTLWKELSSAADACQFYNLQGLRFSTLHIDDCAFAYSPIAKNIEESNVCVCEACPNGIELDPGEAIAVEGVEGLLVTPVNSKLIEQLCGELAEVDDRPISERIATAVEDAKAAAETKIEELKEKLAEAQAAAKTAVEEYKNRIKIRKVEYSVKSSPLKIGDHRVKIPPMFLVGVDEDLEKKLQASYRIFPSDEEISAYLNNVAHLSIENDFKDVDANVRKLLISVRKFGLYVRITDLEEFERRVKILRDKCEAFGEATRKFLREKKTESQRKLFEILMRQWRASRNPWWKEVLKRDPKGEEELFKIFQEEMDDDAKGIEAVIEKFRPTVDERIFMLEDRMAEDEEFRSALYKALREKRREDPQWPLLRPEELLGGVNEGRESK